MKLLAEMKDLNLNGFIAPGHVSTIIGLRPYEMFPERYGMPTIVAGFEPLDVLFTVYMILKQLKQRKPALQNEYTRVVRHEGNIKAQQILHSVFEIENGKWRGLGTIASSKHKLKEEHSVYDAHSRYEVRTEDSVDIQPGCKCHLVIIGRIRPTECSLFMKGCTPERPVGACMVSSEGTCRIWAKPGKTDTKTLSCGKALWIKMKPFGRGS